MDMIYRLLRATCVYCKGFRLPPKDLHKYTCRLKLLQYGLINEAHTVASIGENDLGLGLDKDMGIESEAEEEGKQSIDNITRARDKYVRQCLQNAGTSKRGDFSKGKHEGAIELRREIIREFLAEITSKRLCNSCGGISPSYRKNGFVKIFERSLSGKEKVKMAQKGFKKWGDALTRAYQQQSKLRSQVDEAIADVDAEAMDVDIPEQDPEAPPIDNAMEPFERYLSAMEVRARLAELFTKEQELLGLVYNAKPLTRNSPKVTPDMFFMETILVPPNRFRPEARTGASEIAEAQQNSLYKGVLKSCGRIALVYTALRENRTDIMNLHQACAELQEAINSLIDKDKNPIQGAAAARNEDGIKQKLEKKEGLFRKNMMGKRVNYAARSVISPDPNIETNEIGVPPVFARKLTYPEPVTSHNFRDMQQAVINGPEKWPGAFAIENENGQVINLRNKSAEDRISLANQLLAPTDSNTPTSRNKKVMRHLTNGDVVLMNRQPTLHKPSIMGHRVRVLPGEKTIRMFISSPSKSAL